MDHIPNDSLIPWTEYVGKVIDISDNTIILAVIRHISLAISPDMIKKSLLRKGQHIGILALDDGSIRIRIAQLQQTNQKEVITN